MQKDLDTRRSFLFAAGAALTLFPFVAFAQTRTLSMPAPSWGSMDDYIVTIINIVQTMGLGVAVAWLAFSGFVLVMARGDEAALPDAKKRFLIAFLVTLALASLRVFWTMLVGTYAVLGFMATVFIILFVFWGLKR